MKMKWNLDQIENKLDLYLMGQKLIKYSQYTPYDGLQFT